MNAPLIETRALRLAAAAAYERDFARWRRFAQVSAVRQRQFAFIDGDLIGRMGPRFVQGAGALCEAIDRARSK